MVPGGMYYYWKEEVKLQGSTKGSNMKNIALIYNVDKVAQAIEQGSLPDEFAHLLRTAR